MEGLNKTLKNIVNIIGFISLIIFLFCKIDLYIKSETYNKILYVKNQVF